MTHKNKIIKINIFALIILSAGALWAEYYDYNFQKIDQVFEELKEPRNNIPANIQDFVFRLLQQANIKDQVDALKSPKPSQIDPIIVYLKKVRAQAGKSLSEREERLLPIQIEVLREDQVFNYLKTLSDHHQKIGDWDRRPVDSLMHYLYHPWDNSIQKIAVPTEQQREKLSEIFTKSGFLIKKPTEQEQAELENPRTRVVKLLQNHPDIDTLLIGGGNYPLEMPGIPLHTIRDSKIMTIDANPLSSPHVTANIHNADLLTALPNNRFSKIIDETNHVPFGQALGRDDGLYDNNIETLRQLYRTLKPGGVYEWTGWYHEHKKTSHEISPQEKELLEKIGFKLEFENNRLSRLLKPIQ